MVEIDMAWLDILVSQPKKNIFLVRHKKTLLKKLTNFHISILKTILSLLAYLWSI